jgi:hypothetical protein
MKALALYLVAGIAIGLRTFALITQAIWGTPTIRLYNVSFLGSVLLIVAAAIAPFRQQLAARIALTGCVAAWVFYIPALLYNFWALITEIHAAASPAFSTHASFSGRNLFEWTVAFCPAIILLFVTAYAAKRVPNQPQTP